MAVGDELNCCGNELEGVEIWNELRELMMRDESTKKHDTSGKFTFYLLLSSAFHKNTTFKIPHTSIVPS